MHDTDNIPFIKLNNIRYIINCTDDIPNLHSWIEYMRIPIYDHEDEDISSYFDQAIYFINKAREKGDGAVMIHCMAGVSRSSTITLAYLLHLGKTLEDSLEYLTERRTMICPNEGFFYQLKKRDRSCTLTYEAYLSDIYYQSRDTIFQRVIDLD
jgi:dual specificity MAP kinase phosphatase